ncbi:PREDICTED: protein gar2-like [Polistes dominula]|uniref:Protein gar2-like n=1 Tax=Polistes dominula TaxID=743375 RepID=A0ABM1IGP3_POLDO|nr:PREDICTED: protein gar2-like [Polistes dominula]
MRHDLVLGTNFLNNVKLSIESGHVEVRRSGKAKPTEGNLPNVFSINVCDSESRIGLSHLGAAKIKESAISSVAVRTTRRTVMADISKDEIRREVTAILKDTDLITMLEEKVKQRIEKKLDVDLIAKREEVHDLVIEGLQGKQNSEKEKNKAASEGSDDRENEEEEEEEKEEEKKPTRRSPTKKSTSKHKRDSSADEESVSDSDSDEDWGKNKKGPRSIRKVTVRARVENILILLHCLLN